MARLASVSMTRYSFYEAMDADDKDSMADWFETLYHHYQRRGQLLKNTIKVVPYNEDIN